MRRLALGIAALAVGLTVARAQAPASSDGANLVEPPELRGTPAVGPDGRKARRRATHSTPDHPVAGRIPADEPRHFIAPTDRPVGFGVQVRGGSGDTQHYSPTGAITPGEESGTGVAAGIKFGF